MSKEKQIEEMVSDLENHTCMSQFQAEIASRMLYQLGYRKQSEWISVDERLPEKKKLYYVVLAWFKMFTPIKGITFGKIVMGITKKTNRSPIGCHFPNHRR